MQLRNETLSVVSSMLFLPTPASVNLWVFIVNGVQCGVPVEPPTGVLGTQTGSWTRLDGSLACTIQTHLFSTLSSILTCQLLSQDEFKPTKDKFFALNAANFMARCASFTDLSHKHMYLDETVPTPAHARFPAILCSHRTQSFIDSSRCDRQDRGWDFIQVYNQCVQLYDR
ncbi:hypothetical protein PsorP6_007502 [Peronosclerospora sorghi]|uniref:Uncharacterized protein n=1 Tax=Peronosclerospora sorghi TaxID=230839 RepID=A0ACC0WDA5_9STRA|nr:hypothetical protein PsorP6_007502 [Peronosclerospora sorghi]